MDAENSSNTNPFLDQENRANGLLEAYATESGENRTVEIADSELGDRHLTIDQFLSEGNGIIASTPHVRILFIRRNQLPVVQLRRLAKAFSIPGLFWEIDGNGLSGSGSYEKGGTEIAYVWISALWKRIHGPNLGSSWEIPAMFLHWSRTKQHPNDQGHNITLLCSDIPDTLKASLRQIIASPGNIANAVFEEPLQLFCPFFVVWHAQNHDYFWQLERLVQHYEDRQSGIDVFKPGVPYHPNFSFMHLVAKHITHGLEMFEAANNSIAGLKGTHERLCENSSAAPGHFAANLATHRVLFQNDFVQFCTLERRMANQISLAFNLTSILDAKISQQQSTAMSAIAILTLTFLPTTALASILATPFFIRAADRLDIKPDFGFFWIAAAVLTVVVLVVFYCFRKRTNRKQMMYVDRFET